MKSLKKLEPSVIYEARRRNEPSARYLCRDEVFARDASKEGCGAHEILELPDETEGVEASNSLGRESVLPCSLSRNPTPQV